MAGSATTLAGAIVKIATIDQTAAPIQLKSFVSGTMSTKRGHEKAVRLKNVNADDPATARISAALGADIATRFGPPEAKPLSIIADAEGVLVGGLLGGSHWRWLYIRQLWVTPAWRGRGLGGTLLASAEAHARAENCVGMYIDTFDPENVRFYERKGFTACGRIDDFPPGFSRTFLRRTF